MAANGSAVLINDQFAEATDMGNKDISRRRFFLNTARGNIQQTVILAAGLDVCAYRLLWPSHTTVIQIYQPQVICIKDHDASRPKAPSRRRSNAPWGSTWTTNVERGKLADVPSTGYSRPAVLQHHRAQRAGKPARHRIPSGFGCDDVAERAGLQASGGSNWVAASTCPDCSATASAAMSFITWPIAAGR